MEIKCYKNGEWKPIYNNTLVLKYQIGNALYTIEHWLQF